jgi:hypothetical protein
MAASISTLDCGTSGQLHSSPIAGKHLGMSGAGVIRKRSLAGWTRMSNTVIYLTVRQTSGTAIVF